MESSVLWIWLAEAIGQGSPLYGKLRSLGYSVRDIYALDEYGLSSLFEKKTKAITNLLDKSLERAMHIREVCSQKGIAVYTPDTPEYPASLFDLKDPPAVLYVKGSCKPSEWGFTLGVVGTRKPTPYGKSIAYALSRTSAKAGATVISGLALGIDSIAHAGALAAGGVTVAVLASGVDVISPSRHRQLAEAVLQNGALVSEYPPGTSPRAYHFPCRNRLVAALCHSLAVLEGGMDSGAMITAREAQALEKPIYALPGRIDDKEAEGPMQLLTEGARILRSETCIAEDFKAAFVPLSKPSQTEEISLEEAECRFALLDIPTSSAPKAKPQAKPQPEPPPQPKPKAVDISFLSPVEKAVYLRIPEQGTCLPDDLLCEGVGISDIMRMLTQFEIEGIILRHAGGRVSRL